jgi:hypothetical protein
MTKNDEGFEKGRIKDDIQIDFDPYPCKSCRDIYHSECRGRRGQFFALEHIHVACPPDLFYTGYRNYPGLVLEQLFPVSKSDGRVVGEIQAVVEDP